MDLQQLDEILTRLCVTMKSGIDGNVKWRIDTTSNAASGCLLFEEYRPLYTIPIPKTEDLSHIYWSLAYQSINEGILELEKAKEIYKHFNNIEA